MIEVDIVMKKPFGIIFDVGDTLVQHNKVDVLEANRRLLAISHNPDNIKLEEVHRLASEYGKYISAKRDEAFLEVNWQGFQRFVFESLNITIPKAPQEIEEIFVLSAFQSSPSEGVYELLELLDKYGIKKGCLSNSMFSGQTIFTELKQHSLHDKFDFFISSADYCFRKPYKPIFDLAVKKMGLAREDIWFIGDSMEYDIKGAANAGIFPVWYNCKGIKADFKGLEVNCFSELMDLIKKLWERDR